MKKWLAKIFGLNAAKEDAPRAKLESPAVHIIEGSADVVFKDLVLKNVEGETLIDYGCYTLVPGDRMLLKGPAGCGKSAGLAAMRNAWLLGGSGEITVPPEVRFVPQEEYFPNRTLRGIVCAPDTESRFTKEEVAQALADAGLEMFIVEMGDPEKRGEYWKNTLSGGQKNKLGFAGIFLHVKDVKVLVVDEITAALDAKSEAELYPKLLERMKHGVVISVAHHATLVSHHNIFATVADGKVKYEKIAPEKNPSPPSGPSH